MFLIDNNENTHLEAYGIEPKNKNETHISSGDSLAMNTTVGEPANVTNTDVGSTNSTATVSDNTTPQPTQGHMFQSESTLIALPASNTTGSDTATNSTGSDTATNILNGTNVEKGNY